MSTIEQIKIHSHLEAKCKAKNLHYSYKVTNGTDLEVEIWTESNRGRTILSAEADLREENAVRAMLLKINEAISEEKLENIFS